jgi:hypothetical protein
LTFFAVFEILPKTLPLFMKIINITNKTKQLLLGSGLLTVLLSSTQAALLLYEDFGYAATTSLTSANSGTGNWTSAWATAPTTSSTTITSSGLTYSGLPTAGNATSESNSASQGNTRPWSGSGLFTDSSELWFSVLVNTSAASSDLRFYALSAPDPGSNGGAGFRISGTSINAQIGTSSSGGSFSVTSGSTMLLVGRLGFSDTINADSVSLWLNPTISVTPPTGGISLSGNIGNTGSPLVALRGGFTWGGVVDEIRVGTTFGDVVAVPEPSTVSLLALAAGFAWMRSRRARRTSGS